MNHPEIISKIEVPGYLVPSQYHYKNWNRSSLTKSTFSKKHNLAFAGGKSGMWVSEDSLRTFKEFMNGYTSSLYYLKTNDLYLIEDSTESILFAGNNEGLFRCDLPGTKWERVLVEKEIEPVKKIIGSQGKLIVVTDSDIYISDKTSDYAKFSQITPERENYVPKVSLIDLFFHLHDGRIWGLPGRLLFDVTGIILIILSITAFYTWYLPNKIKRLRKRKKTVKKSEKRIFKFLFKYHLKFGLYSALFAFIISGTAFFMRPPTIIIIANGSISPMFYPGPLPQNIWKEKIQNAFYDESENKLYISAKDGIWIMENLQTPLAYEFDKKIPVFVMGATVFENYSKNEYLVGSFNGLFRVNKEEGQLTNHITNSPAGLISNVMPADTMITGYLETPDNRIFISSHNHGIISLDGKVDSLFIMPEKLRTNFSMPLWNYLFEIHNGRFFKFLIGGFYILLIPLGSLSLFIITITGIYDWFMVKRKPKPQT